MPDCSSLIVSEETGDYIIEYNSLYFEQIQRQDGVCISCINDTWCILYTNYPGSRNINIQQGYYSVPKLYGLMDTTSFDASGITATLNQPLLNVRGQGVLIGFLDTGIDYLREDFKASGGRTRIAAVWDQTIQSVNYEEDTGEAAGTEQYDREQAQGMVQYGTVYTREDINAALAAEREGQNPYDIVPSRDENGHGTFLAGVAAASETADYIGAAPEAEILMVKLKPAKKYLRDFYLLPEQVEAYSETDMMMGVRFLQQYAIREKKPLVICVGLGTASGSRTGALPFADLLNTLARQVNTVVVTCTGNEANNRTHTSGLAVSDTEPSEIEITVGADERGFVMEIWAESLDILSVAITSPSGERISRIPARIDTGGVYNFLLERSQVAVNYRVVESASGYEVIFMRFINPAQGIWKIHVYSLTNIVGRYNAWLPLKQFLSGDTYFLNSNPSTTLTEPGAAERVISVGAYNHITDASYVASGRGYTATGLVKPDFVAPGVDVYGVRAGGGYTTRTGTSVAAAHAAGAAALLLTWGVTDGNLPYMGTNEVKSVLIRGAKRENNTVYPNNIYGYGKMDVIEAFYKLRTG
ncbi:S8 family peptidase [Lachnospira pectinoschiza]|uniref:S8 family peptidase n=1 Tax=Lachnospira pectinoschiza TaxID=28052 RepID=UPI001D0821A1|nr:S8 family peptidase [Lachnospira pectinoschiza]MCB6143807.1 S8 family peptidase [Lachnospira pectinoschiza]